MKEEEHPKRLSNMLHVSGVGPPDTYIRISRNPINPGQAHALCSPGVSTGLGCISLGGRLCTAIGSPRPAHPVQKPDTS